MFEEKLIEITEFERESNLIIRFHCYFQNNNEYLHKHRYYNSDTFNQSICSESFDLICK